MIGREKLSLYVIQISLGVGGGFLSAVFASEAYLEGGFAVPFALGVFVMVGLCARIFGRVRLWVYCVATLAWLALLLLLGLPR